MNNTIESRAVMIAAKMMQAAGLCRYDTPDKCRRLCPTELDCQTCIRQWLLTKAKKEIDSQHEEKKETKETLSPSPREEWAEIVAEEWKEEKADGTEIG